MLIYPPICMQCTVDACSVASQGQKKTHTLSTSASAGQAALDVEPETPPSVGLLVGSGRLAGIATEQSLQARGAEAEAEAEADLVRLVSSPSGQGRYHICNDPKFLG